MASKKVLVVDLPESAVSERIKDLLSEIECVEIVGAIENADIVAVPMGLPLDEKGLRKSLERALDGAFEVLGIHAPDGDGSVPEALEDLTTIGHYPLDRDALEAAICEDAQEWLKADGMPRPASETKRHCLKRKAC